MSAPGNQFGYVPKPGQPASNNPAPAARQPPPPQVPRPAPPRQFGREQVEHLTRQGFSMGLIRAISLSAGSFPLRMWIICNSSTMQNRDGHKLGGSIENIKMVSCSRWEELLETVNYHIDVAGSLGLPARFMMVNSGEAGGPKRFSVGENGPGSALRDIRLAKDSISSVVTSGGTPITAFINNVRQEISSLAPMLNRERKAVTLVLALDGLPSDEYGNESPAVLQNFVQALRSLENLPVTVVVRLCTDDERVVDFYNTIDAKLNLRLDVLNDFFSEALEVFLRNPWLTYNYALHRFRELGFIFSATDELDERALTFSELRELCSILFSLGEGNTRVVLPDPATQWQSFMNALSSLISKEKHQFNPITKKLEPWIDLNRLHINYAGQSLPQRVPQGPQVTFHQAQQPQVQQQQFQNVPQNNQGCYQQNQARQGYPSQQPPPLFSRQQPPLHQSTTRQQPMAQPCGPHQPTPLSNTASRSQQQPPASSLRGSPSSSSHPTSQHSVVDKSSIKQNVLTSWALQPPQYTALRPIDQLLSTVQATFPPAFGLPPHNYFKKWKPFSPGAFSSGEHAVLKKAMRKMKFFLHPDKLPHDLSTNQAFLCKMLWDVTSDSWEATAQH